MVRSEEGGACFSSFVVFTFPIGPETMGKIYEALFLTHWNGAIVIPLSLKSLLEVSLIYKKQAHI